MNILTVNAHAWMEDQQEKKLDDLARFIVDRKVDLVCLQEVNQSIEASVVKNPLAYVEIDSYFDIPIKLDNYLLALAGRLADYGLVYQWSWVPTHKAYETLEEGVGILANRPFKPEDIGLSEIVDFEDFRTRRIIKADFGDFSLFSAHLSWWETDALGQPFKGEWDKLLPHLEGPLILAGDLNVDVGVKGEGYDYIQKSATFLKDAYQEADRKIGNITVPGAIDGWEEAGEAKRIDYVWLTDDFSVDLYEVVFDGRSSPRISDHFGIFVSLH